MELKLIVLAGAKEGLEIPLKKDKFLIGRAKECSLRAGSEAISRRHCAILRVKDKWAVRDLGSRNGTYVNDKRIEQPTRIRPGDEVRVGPLRFRVELVAATKSAEPAGSAPALKSSVPAPAAEKPRNQPQPPEKKVADVVERTINKSSDSASEDDISRWLLGMPDANGDANLRETRAIHLEETRAHGRVPITSDSSVTETVELDAETAVGEASASDDSNAAAEESSAEGEKSSRWGGLFKRGKNGAKKKPGKLPPRPDQATKDSREAAADILREMTRRR
jgi:pSer/pThr/pTyr-binding forkhead associated (FHA) protein